MSERGQRVGRADALGVGDGRHGGVVRLGQLLRGRQPALLLEFFGLRDIGFRVSDGRGQRVGGVADVVGGVVDRVQQGVGLRQRRFGTTDGIHEAHLLALQGAGRQFAPVRDAGIGKADTLGGLGDVVTDGCQCRGIEFGAQLAENPFGLR
ncbi:Uncharacterised protein [Mycobacteroides abscessus subsp. abscessus]|nr:Uncharacterised protein [Mycobacteroides abscessus subsp. abscessus]